MVLNIDGIKYSRAQIRDLYQESLFIND